MEIIIDKKLRTPLYWQIADQLKEMIVSGNMADGTILPSEAVSLAQLLGVHRKHGDQSLFPSERPELIDSFQGVRYR